MADIHRRLLDKKTGKGGVTCYCCNWTKDKNDGSRYRTKLRKIVRSILKREVKNEIEEYE